MKTNIKPLPMNDNLTSCCVKRFENFLEEEKIPSGESTFYDILTAHNYFSISPKEKGVYFNKARTILQEKENNKKIGRIQVDKYKNRSGLSVVFQAKVLALEDYFRKIQSEGKHLKDILI